MRIRNALLAVAATIAAGSAIAAPALAQDYGRPVYERGYAPVYYRPAFEPGYAPVYGPGYGYGYHRPWFEGRPYWFHHDVYRGHYGYGYPRW